MLCQNGLDMLGTCRFFAVIGNGSPDLLLSKITTATKKGAKTWGTEKKLKKMFLKKSYAKIKNHEQHFAVNTGTRVFGGLAWIFTLEQSNLRKSKLMAINSTSGPGVEVLKQIRNQKFGPWNLEFGDKMLFVFKIYCICYLSFYRHLKKYNHIDLIFCEGFRNNLQLNLTSPWEMCIHAYIYPALGRWDFPPRNSSQETGGNCRNIGFCGTNRAILQPINDGELCVFCVRKRPLFFVSPNLYVVLSPKDELFIQSEFMEIDGELQMWS